MKRTFASRNIALGFLALIAVAGFSGRAEAAVNGYLSKTVTLRAGPAANFPALVKVAGKPAVVVYGCTTNNWCDVGLNGARGWLPGKYVITTYRQSHYPVITYREQLGLPLLAFSQIDYWNQYYPTYSFYRNQSYWTHGEQLDPRSGRYIVYQDRGRPGFDNRGPDNRGPDGHWDNDRRDDDRYDNRYDNNRYDNDRWDNGHDGHYNR
ncbi:MAG: hypothetical protein PW788_12350 [Micavibrio sp.]|nr:hypothetical protein [Micavibrio sp.]